MSLLLLFPKIRSSVLQLNEVIFIKNFKKENEKQYTFSYHIVALIDKLRRYNFIKEKNKQLRFERRM